MRPDKRGGGFLTSLYQRVNSAREPHLQWSEQIQLWKEKKTSRGAKKKGESELGGSPLH